MCCRLNTNISYISLWTFLSIFTFKMPCVRKLKIENIRIHNENAKCTVCESAQSWLGWSIDPLANYWPLVFALRRTHVHHHHQHHDHQLNIIAFSTTTSITVIVITITIKMHEMRRSHLWSVFQVCVCNVQPETSKDPHRESQCPIQNRNYLRGHTSIDMVKGWTLRL